MKSHLFTFLFEHVQETNESTGIEHQNTQPEEGKKQGQDVFPVVHSAEQDVFPIVDSSAATGEQDPKPSLNKEEVAETAPTTRTEEVKLQNLFL